jgi:hypothetical protein
VAVRGIALLTEIPMSLPILMKALRKLYRAIQAAQMRRIRMELALHRRRT